MTRLLIASWRDTLHPDSGGSERYVERIASGLAERGYEVSVLCPRHPNAGRTDVIDGVRYIRRGGVFTVYLWALLTVVWQRPDVVIDVQNGMPFLSTLVARCPVIVLVHHLHRLQWRSYFGKRMGRIGWWVESWLAPRIYRRCRYVAVSEHTRAELAALGVAADRISVVLNGLDPVPHTTEERAPEPLLVAVSRLVPHKQIEHAIETVARLHPAWPGIRLDIVGRGPWHDYLVNYAAERGVSDRVTFRGWVSEQHKHEILARSWVHLCPSVKEGWGIVVMEAAAHGVPTVAYHAAGGVGESVIDWCTGLLVDDLDDFVGAAELLLRCEWLRAAMGARSREHVSRYEWKHSVDSFDDVVRAVLPQRPGRTADQPAPAQR